MVQHRTSKKMPWAGKECADTSAGKTLVYAAHGEHPAACGWRKAPGTPPMRLEVDTGHNQDLRNPAKQDQEEF